MKRCILVIIIMFTLALPVSAMEFDAPVVPDDGAQYMPQEITSFGKDLWFIIKSVVLNIKPEIARAAALCLNLIGIVLLSAMLAGITERTKALTEFVAIVAIAILLLQTTDALINLGAQTVKRISEYGKLLMPVMTAAMAAQGGVTSSAALYTGTSIFSTVLTNVIGELLVPLLYVYLCLCIASNAIAEDILKKLRNLVKWVLTWSLKLILYVFTGYISISGVVSGSADASMIKATKLTLSGSIPVVGSIISDASETILVSAGMMKNAAGVYGVLAIIALWIGPFIKVVIQYLLLKMTAAVCSVFGTKRVVSLIQDISSAMGFVLAMISTISLLLTIAVVCFMKGVSG